MCIEMFPPEKAASRIADFVKADRKHREDCARFERSLERLGVGGEKQTLTKSIKKWLSAKGIEDHAGTKCMQIVNKILEETK